MSLKDQRSLLELLASIGIVSIAERMKLGRLRWFRRVERKSGDDWVSTCRDLVVEGVRGVDRGRRSNKWLDRVVNDMRDLGLRREDAMDRAVWRGGILGNRPTRARAETWTLKRR
jgi:hypothetical protein